MQKPTWCDRIGGNMKISIDDIRRIIKEEFAAGSSPAEQDKKGQGQQQGTPKITDATAAAAAKASEKNAQVQKGAEKAAERGGSTLVNSILADLSKFTKRGVSKKDLMDALKKAIVKIPND